MPDLPQTAVSPVILNNLEEPTGCLPLLKDELDFFSYLEDATSIPPEEESFVDDMCGQRVDAKNRCLCYGALTYYRFEVFTACAQRVSKTC